MKFLYVSLFAIAGFFAAYAAQIIDSPQSAAIGALAVFALMACVLLYSWRVWYQHVSAETRRLNRLITKIQKDANKDCNRRVNDAVRNAFNEWLGIARQMSREEDADDDRSHVFELLINALSTLIDKSSAQTVNVGGDYIGNDKSEQSGGASISSGGDVAVGGNVAGHDQ